MPFGPNSRAVLCARARKRKLAHRENRRVRKAFNAGAGAGQQDRAAAARDHAAGRLLDDEKTAVRGYFEGLARGFRVDFGDRSGRSGAGIIKYRIGLAEPRVHRLEQMRDRGRIRGIDGKAFSTDVAGERCQLIDITGRQPDL